MEDSRQIKPKPIYEFIINDVTESIFTQNNNSDYESEFWQQIETALTKKQKDFEKVIADANDELYSRNARFGELAKACSKLYYNLLFNEDTSNKKNIQLVDNLERKKLNKDLENSKLTEYEKQNKIRNFWNRNQYFNAILCILFLQYQQEKIIELIEVIEKNKLKRGKIKLPQKIVLLNELGFFELARFNIYNSEKQYDILMYLLDGDATNIKKHMNGLKKPKGHPYNPETLHQQTVLNFLNGIGNGFGE